MLWLPPEFNSPWENQAHTSKQQHRGASSPVTWILGSLAHSGYSNPKWRFQNHWPLRPGGYPVWKNMPLETHHPRKRWKQTKGKENHIWVQSHPRNNLGRLRVTDQRSQVNASLQICCSMPPRSDQLRCSTWKGLKSRALTAPECFCLWAITGSFPEDKMWVTLYRVSMPLSPPPAMTPEASRSPLPKLPQISLWNLQRGGTNISNNSGPHQSVENGHLYQPLPLRRHPTLRACLSPSFPRAEQKSPLPGPALWLRKILQIDYFT